MAQFSHSDFGGMSQWSPGMTMVGDMFNNSLRSKLDSICTELATYVAQTQSGAFGRDRQTVEASYRAVNRGRIGGQLILGNQVQLAHKITLGTQYSHDDLLSMMVGTSRFTIRAIIESSVWSKRKAAIKR
jgi:hypothetical protein